MTARHRPPVGDLTPHEEGELRRLVEEAWELRGTGYILDACVAIEDWWKTRWLRQIVRLEAERACISRELEAIREQEGRRAA